MLTFNWYATFKTKKKSFALQFLCEDQATYRNCLSPNAQRPAPLSAPYPDNNLNPKTHAHLSINSHTL